MAIEVPSGLRVTAAEPIDERLLLTKAQMLAVVDSAMPSQYFAICAPANATDTDSDIGKLFVYDKRITSPSATTGKFTLYASGGGTATEELFIISSATLTDTSFTVNKTPDEVATALTAGKLLVLKLANTTDSDYLVLQHKDSTNNIYYATMINDGKQIEYKMTVSSGAFVGTITATNLVVSVSAGNGLKTADGQPITSSGTLSIDASSATAGQVMTAKADHTVEWTTLVNFTGAQTSAAGAAGLVPAPNSGETNKFLKSNGNWEDISISSSVYPVVATAGTTTGNDVECTLDKTYADIKDAWTNDKVITITLNITSEGIYRGLLTTYYGDTTGNGFGGRVFVDGKVANSKKWLNLHIRPDGTAVATHGEFSDVSVSDTGTSTDEIGYITVDGTEYKLAGGASNLYILNGTASSATEFEIDKTKEEVEAAVSAGKLLILRMTLSGGNEAISMPLTRYKTNYTSLVFGEILNGINCTFDLGLVEGTSTYEGAISSKTLNSVSVSDSGTATDEISYITIDGVQKKIAGGEGGTVAYIGETQPTSGTNKQIWAKGISSGTTALVHNGTTTAQSVCLKINPNSVSIEEGKWLTNVGFYYVTTNGTAAGYVITEDSRDGYTRGTGTEAVDFGDITDTMISADVGAGYLDVFYSDEYDQIASLNCFGCIKSNQYAHKEDFDVHIKDLTLETTGISKDGTTYEWNTAELTEQIETWMDDASTVEATFGTDAEFAGYTLATAPTTLLADKIANFTSKNIMDHYELYVHDGDAWRIGYTEGKVSYMTDTAPGNSQKKELWVKEIRDGDEYLAHGEDQEEVTAHTAYKSAGNYAIYTGETVRITSINYFKSVTGQCTVSETGVTPPGETEIAYSSLTSTQVTTWAKDGKLEKIEDWSEISTTVCFAMDKDHDIGYKTNWTAHVDCVSIDEDEVTVGTYTVSYVNLDEATVSGWISAGHVDTYLGTDIPEDSFVKYTTETVTDGFDYCGAFDTVQEITDYELYVSDGEDWNQISSSGGSSITEYLKSGTVSGQSISIKKQDDTEAIRCDLFTTISSDATSLAGMKINDVSYQFSGNDMGKATETTDGKHGLVPYPHAGDQEKFLRGDGTWAEPAGSEPALYIKKIELSSDATSLVITKQNDSTETLTPTASCATGSTNGSISYNGTDVAVAGLQGSAYKAWVDTVSSSSTDLVTSAGVYNAIQALTTSMVYKGTVGTGGTREDLPEANADHLGWTYKVIEAKEYAGQTAAIGDLFICAELGTSTYGWTRVPAGETSDTWRQINVNGTEFKGSSMTTGTVNFKAGNGITLSTSGNDLTIASKTTFQLTGSTLVITTAS